MVENIKKGNFCTYISNERVQCLNSVHCTVLCLMLLNIQILMYCMILWFTCMLFRIVVLNCIVLC